MELDKVGQLTPGGDGLLASLPCSAVLSGTSRDVSPDSNGRVSTNNPETEHEDDGDEVDGRGVFITHIEDVDGGGNMEGGDDERIPDDKNEDTHGAYEAVDGLEQPDVEGLDPEKDMDDDDDFGSFDEASFEEYQAPETPNQTSVEFSSAVLSDPEQFRLHLDESLGLAIAQTAPCPDIGSPVVAAELLTEKARATLETFSMLPRLNPPNWTRLKMRHELLVSLGVPINLDELDTTHATPSSKLLSRRRSITEQNIQWGEFVVPDIASLLLSPDLQLELMANTVDILSRIEGDNLTNTTELFLQQCSEDMIDEKIRQMRANCALLVELSSVWQAQLKELRNSQEAFESVVQNMIGYRQKLQRNEIMQNIRGKAGKRIF